MQPQKQSPQLETLSLRSWEEWRRLVDSDRFHLMRQALTGFRFHLLGVQLEQASNKTIPRDDRLEMAAETRGMIRMCDFILVGGLDETVRNLLGFPATPPAPPDEYMAREWQPEETKQ